MIKIIELFAGIGSQYQALKNQNIDCEVVGISEWNVDSLIAYNLLHNNPEECLLSKEEILKELKGYTFSTTGKIPTDIKKFNLEKLRKLYTANKNNKNLGSIMDIKSLPYCDLLTYSFPCQDLSFAGKGKGLIHSKKSSLLWEVERLLLNSEKPKYLLMENVPALITKRYINDFKIWTDKLESLNYKNYIFTLNSIYFNIPQNRNRVFMVSILNGNDNDFIAPKELNKTELRLKDIMDENVDEYFYIDNNECEPYFPKDMYLRKINNNSLLHNFECNKIKYRLSNFICFQDSVSPTIPFTLNGKMNIKVLLDNGRLRFLTDKETMLLFGFKEEEYNKIKDHFSYRKIASMSGNSIVVPVLESIFKNMFKYE